MSPCWLAQRTVSMSNPGGIYGLLIGVNHYDSATLRPLRFATADVLAFRECLRSRADLTDERCKVLVQTSGGPPLTRSAILSALDAFASAPLTPEDTFVLFFAGHGFAFDELADHAYLLAADSVKGSRELLEDTAISLPRLKGFLNKIKAGHKLLILDACRSDPNLHARGDAATVTETFTRDIVFLARADEPATEGRVPERGRAVLSSCWHGQLAYEFPAAKQSWFMKHLLDALHAHPGGELAFTHEFVATVTQRMQEAAWKDLPEAAKQEPHLEVSGHPVRLGLAPLQTLTDLAEPSRVKIKEPVIAPFTVQVERVAQPQVRIAGIPDIPADILELEGIVQGLEQAIRQLQEATHPSLRPAQEAVAQAQEQYATLRRDLEENTPELPAALQGEIAAAVANDPRGSVAALLERLPASLSFDDQMDYLARLRNVEEARRISAATEQAYETERTRQCGQLQTQLDESGTELAQKQLRDWMAITQLFFQRRGRIDGFPVREWKEFNQRVLKSRRYPWNDRELLGMSEGYFPFWTDHAAWATATGSDTQEAIAAYASQFPAGQHIAEARARLNAAHQELAERRWPELAASTNIFKIEDFLREFQGTIRAAEAQQRLAFLREEQEWLAVRRVNSIEGYRNYLNSGANSLFVPQAKGALAQALRHELLLGSEVLRGSDINRLRDQYNLLRVKSVKYPEIKTLLDEYDRIKSLRDEYNGLKPPALVALDTQRAAFLLTGGVVFSLLAWAVCGFVFGFCGGGVLGCLAATIRNLLWWIFTDETFLQLYDAHVKAWSLSVGWFIAVLSTFILPMKFTARWMPEKLKSSYQDSKQFGPKGIWETISSVWR